MPQLLGMLLTQGPCRLPVRAPWPLHQALADLKATAEQAGLADQLPAMTFKPDPEVGMIEETAVIAMHQLINDGFLRPAGEGWDAALEVADQARLRSYRRLLMGLEPELATLIYQAGSNWAALALTAEKNWASALESVARRRASATPKRRQGATRVVR